MNKLGLLDFLRKLGQQDFPQETFVLTGSDEYLHDLALKKLEAHYLEPDFRDFNFRRLELSRGTSYGEVLGLLSELPTLVDHRLVLLTRVTALNKDVSQQLAANYEGDLAPGTIMVATAGGSPADSPFYKTLVKKALVVDCALKDSEINLLLTSFCKKHKVRVDSTALKVLRDRVGESTRSLIGHLERCVLSLSPGDTLEASQITRLVPFSAQVAMWKMTAAIGRRDHTEALKILDHQMDKGESPSAILGYINSYLTSLIQTGGLMRQLGSTAAVAQAIPRKKEFQVKKTLEELRTWSAQELEAALQALVRADFKCKGGEGGGEPRLLLQMLVLKMCSRKGGRRRS